MKEYFPYHQFSSALHSANDIRTREAFSGLFIRCGCAVNESGKYDTDLSIRRPDASQLDLDVECRLTPRWRTSGEFPFQTLEIGLRRREKLEGNPNLVFAVMNRDGSSWIAASGQTFAAHAKEITKLVAGQPDKFLSLPVGLAMQGHF